MTAALLAGSAWAQSTQLVSVDSSGAQGNATSRFSSVSADGRYVVFASSATNLVPSDTNGFIDVFVRDRQTGTTELASVSSSGVQGNGNSGDSIGGSLPGFAISADGRYVAFWSQATNLVASDTNGFIDVFVRDRQAGTTELVSVSSSGVQGNSYSVGRLAISADGRYVAFFSNASNLVAGDTNHWMDIFVRDRQAGTTERVSVDSSGAQGDGPSFEGPSISADGRYVAFASYATNLVPGDTNATQDVFVHDRQTGATERVSVDSGGIEGDNSSTYPSISADGRYVAFLSSADNLVPGDTNGFSDVFVHDRQTGAIARANVDSSGAQADSESYDPWISADGRYVAFASYAQNLVAGDTNLNLDVFVHDLQTGATERESVDSSGAQGNAGSYFAGISSDGRFVAFTSAASNLVAGDTNGVEDVFVRDRGTTGFTSLCDPGVGGILACPCGNPPSGPGRGCNNSAATGGASLSASGIPSLSSDSLVFATSGEKPTATSIVLQGTSSPASGLVYGQGVRCVGGSLRRLYVKSAVAGSIVAPNFGAGDPSVSARSAALGDAITAGQSRWYLVYYRDPSVLGGCPASSTFNATQTGRVDWSL
jgi:Tol biopolymer transport system component